MTTNDTIRELRRRWQAGEIWLSAVDAAEVLGCQNSSLTNAANKKGTLGDLQFYWAGSVLKISTMSVIRYLSGGYCLRDIFQEVS